MHAEDTGFVLSSVIDKFCRQAGEVDRSIFADAGSGIRFHKLSEPGWS